MMFLTEGGTQPAGGGLLSMLMMFLPIILIFYFLMIRPESKRKKEAEQLRKNLSVGDRITTIGGIVGTIVSIKDDKFVIETSADQVRIEFCKWALSTNDTAVEKAQRRRLQRRIKQNNSMSHNEGGCRPYCGSFF